MKCMHRRQERINIHHKNVFQIAKCLYCGELGVLFYGKTEVDWSRGVKKTAKEILGEKAIWQDAPSGLVRIESSTKVSELPGER